MTLTPFTLLTFDEISSSNDLAFELLEKNAIQNNSIILANSQTKGRGRYDREWSSPVGNIYLSLILQFQNPVNLTDYSFLSACVIGDALKSFGIKVQYKWPNDIIFQDKKLAGILLQNRKINNVENLVIGIGLNLTSAPSYAISLKDYKISKEDFLEKFTAVFSEHKNHYEQFGFTKIRNSWKESAYKLGEHIKLSNGMAGIFLDIDQNGNLLLQDDQKIIHKILAEEIL